MQLLKDRILTDGVVKEGNILKVDSFLNHQMDIDLINEVGKEFKKRFDHCPITPRSLPSRLPVSVLPVLRHSISMYRLYLPRKHRV